MGDTIPADLRIFEVMNPSCDESSLTGEAAPIETTVGDNIVIPVSETPASSEDQAGIGEHCLCHDHREKGLGPRNRRGNRNVD